MMFVYWFVCVLPPDSYTGNISMKNISNGRDCLWKSQLSLCLTGISHCAQQCFTGNSIQEYYGRRLLINLLESNIKQHMCTLYKNNLASVVIILACEHGVVQGGLIYVFKTLIYGVKLQIDTFCSYTRIGNGVKFHLT
jgi:hypothetical protein